MNCDFECLDTIADAVNPALALTAIALALFSPRVRQRGRWHWSGLVVAMLITTYLLQWLDKTVAIWPGLGLDYSTHTAFAVSIGLPIAMLGKRWAIASVVVLVSYAGLMAYQGYHSAADIVSSGVIVGLFGFGFAALLNLIGKRESRASMGVNVDRSSIQ